MKKKVAVFSINKKEFYDFINNRGSSDVNEYVKVSSLEGLTGYELVGEVYLESFRSFFKTLSRENVENFNTAINKAYKDFTLRDMSKWESLLLNKL